MENSNILKHPKKIRRIRICLFWKGYYYSFCWIEFLEDGSFSVGFLSKIFKLTEIGSATLRNGYFSKHIQTLTRGNIKIKDAISPHITFHQPKIEQTIGIVHMIAENGIVDEIELDWFPVKKADTLLYAYTGDIEKLDRDTKKKQRYRVVDVSPNIRCLRMELMIYPRTPKYPQPAKIIHNPNAIANIHGACPDYMLSCFFYKNDVVEPQLYFAAE
jgi:hypothetical protein